MSARRYLVGGNWKCNGTFSFAKQFSHEVLNALKFDASRVEVVVAPSALHVSTVQANVNSNIQVAVQNLSLTGNGAFTGEISAEQIQEAQLRWAITGHSERRHVFGETDNDVGVKTRNALDKGISVLACIGEKIDEREGGQTRAVNERQLNAIREHVEDWTNVVIAYEPVWAIGTGKTATPEIAQDTHAEIRAWLGTNVSAEARDSVRILYGGSVTDANAAELIGQTDIDGFLVGGASLKPIFHNIVDACNTHHSRQ
jgi:triosephosphate isomerase